MMMEKSWRKEIWHFDCMGADPGWREGAMVCCCCYWESSRKPAKRDHMIPPSGRPLKVCISKPP